MQNDGLEKIAVSMSRVQLGYLFELLCREYYEYHSEKIFSPANRDKIQWHYGRVDACNMMLESIIGTIESSSVKSQLYKLMRILSYIYTYEFSKESDLPLLYWIMSFHCTQAINDIFNSR